MQFFCKITLNTFVDTPFKICDLWGPKLTFIILGNFMHRGARKCHQYNNHLCNYDSYFILSNKVLKNEILIVYYPRWLIRQKHL